MQSINIDLKMIPKRKFVIRILIQTSKGKNNRDSLKGFVLFLKNTISKPFVNILVLT